MFLTVLAEYRASPLARRFAGGAMWSVLGAVVSSGVTLITWMFVARLLGKEIYGQLVVIQSTLGAVGIFAGFGIGVVATRYVAELRGHDSARLGHILTLAQRTVLGFGILASTALVIAAPWMATHVLNAPKVEMPLAIAAIAVLFVARDGYQKSVLIGFEAFRAFAIGTIAGVIAGFPIALLAAKYYGINGAASAIVVNAVAQASISRYQMNRELRAQKVRRGARGSLSELPVLWRFALPALVSGALVGPAHWAAMAMLANTPNGYAELAVLGIAMQWFSVIMFIPGTAGRVVLPMLTAHFTKQDHYSSRRILLYSIGANAIFAVPLAVSVSLLSRYIMSLYGGDFQNDYLPLIVATVTATILAIQTPVGNLLTAASKMWLGALMNLGWATLYIGLTIAFIKQGALGVTLALAIAYIVHGGWTLWFAWRYVNPGSIAEEISSP